MATLATTVTEIVTRTVTTSSATATSTSRANPQGGIFEGRNPTHYDVKNPLTLFIIQAVLVIVFTRVLHWPLSKLRQPRVIAEVITGIVLGPSIMGRIPNFTSTIFPTASMPAFTLAANIGLVMFLFLVGLEVDLRFLASNWRVALSVGAAGMGIPFGLGVCIAWGLYHEFHGDANTVPISFGTYALFIGVALAITAFPVLCRILTSLKLLNTPVGIIVLSAGVANDVVGWVLLALCVALVNSGAGVTAFYIFLSAAGFSLFLAYGVRPTFMWILRKSGSLENGPSQAIVALTVFLVLASAFFTDIIGVHPIFGAFMIGLICPHEGGFAIKLTEKIEDLVSVLFLPLYFALSGLNTNLGLLNDGITWAYVICVTAAAFFGKLAGGTFASKLNGLLWRESVTIGVLMSCKGLVELIVLNIGLQARILSVRTFTIFVVMALLTTFTTTPLTTWLYPPWYQEKVTLWKQGKIDWNGNPLVVDDHLDSAQADSDNTDITSRMLVYLRLDGLPSLFNIVSLFTARDVSQQSSHGSLTTMSEHSTSKPAKTNIATHEVMLSLPSNLQKPFRIHGLRMMELSERNSSVMKVSELEDYATRDPVIKAFGTATATQRASRNVTISGQIAVVPDENYASTLVGRARELDSDFILVPWSESGGLSEYPSFYGEKFGHDPISDSQYAAFASSVLDKARSVANVGIFVDKSIFETPGMHRGQSTMSTSGLERSTRQLTRSVTGMSIVDAYDDTAMFRSSDNRGSHQIRTVFRPGSADDLVAVQLALQLAKNEDIDVRIVRISSTPETTTNPSISSAVTNTDDDTDIMTLHSELPPSIRKRVHIDNLTSPTADEITAALLSNHHTESSDVILIIGRSSVTKTQEDKQWSGSIAQGANALGSQAFGMLDSIRATDTAVSLLVVQARRPGMAADETRRKVSRASVRDT